jgi:hypothetical protein
MSWWKRDLQDSTVWRDKHRRTEERRFVRPSTVVEAVFTPLTVYSAAGSYGFYIVPGTFGGIVLTVNGVSLLDNNFFHAGDVLPLSWENQGVHVYVNFPALNAAEIVLVNSVTSEEFGGSLTTDFYDPIRIGTVPVQDVGNPPRLAGAIYRLQSPVGDGSLGVIPRVGNLRRINFTIANGDEGDIEINYIGYADEQTVPTI